MATATTKKPNGTTSTRRINIPPALNGRHIPDTPPQANETRHGNLTTRWEHITPEIATRYRALSGRNRTLMPTWAASIAADMATDDFPETHQGVAFNDKGEMVDANHRLEAIIISGKAQWLLVTRGLSDRAIEAIDRGRVRSLAHTLQIMGYDLSDNRAVAMARSMMSGPGYRRGTVRPTLVAVRKFMEEQREALTFVTSLPGYHHLPAGVTGVLARAYLHVPPSDLWRFTQALGDEIPAEETRPGDRTARALMAGIVRDRQNGGSGRATVYRRTQNALKAYLAGEDKKMVKEVGEDLFPLPTPPEAETTEAASPAA